jgi:nicotinamide riboside transporter PnuC
MGWWLFAALVVIALVCFSVLTALAPVEMICNLFGIEGPVKSMMRRGFSAALVCSRLARVLGFF